MNANAKWIRSTRAPVGETFLFRKKIQIEKPLKKAALTVSSVGTFAVFLDGKRVGDRVLTPGWTDYHYRSQEIEFDLLPLLKQGENILDLGLAEGWTQVGYEIKHIPRDPKDFTSVIASLTLTDADGGETVVSTDGTWDVFSSKILYSSIYGGETVDLTAPVAFLEKAVLSDVPFRPIPQIGPDITEHERLAPIAYIVTPKGERVLDFGQNLTGYVELTIQAAAGTKIVLDFAEVLDKEGNFYTENMRDAKNLITYICDGKPDVFKPTYTFQGFRYVRLTEYPFDGVDFGAFRAVVVHSEMKRTGDFHCGNAKINQLYHNVVWGQKSNYLDIPTDCPQRNERLGWTGDAQVFCRTAAINYDVRAFFRKWLGDMILDQGKNGSIPQVIPDIFAPTTNSSAAWGDVACIIPWELYRAYGDPAVLKQCFPMMKRWVEYIHRDGPEEFLWLGTTYFGDWLAMDAGEDSYSGATPTDLIASAFFAYSTEILVKAGKVLGKDMTKYEKLYTNVVNAFRKRYIVKGKLNLVPQINFGKRTPTVDVKETQTSYVLILAFRLCEEKDRKKLAAALARMIRENGNRMTTGFVGTPYLLHALSENGYTDLAYKLLFAEENPSWLYSVNRDATTMWEHWNGIKEDGSFWSKDMNSFNHYAYGAVFDWIFGVTAGIRTVESAPGYREIDLEPHPYKKLGFADASIESVQGKIRSHWYYKGDRVFYEFSIPEGTVAHLRLPSGYTEDLAAGEYRFAE